MNELTNSLGEARGPGVHVPHAGRCPGSDDAIALANCPFHRLAEEHRDLVCGMNRDFLAGLLDGIGATDGLTARLEPTVGYCCVRIAA